MGELGWGKLFQIITELKQVWIQYFIATQNKKYNQVQATKKLRE